MFECPPEMPFDECLKRLLKSLHVEDPKSVHTQISSSPATHSAPLFLKTHSFGGNYSASYSNSHHSHSMNLFGGSAYKSTNSYSNHSNSRSGGGYGNTSSSSSKGGFVVKDKTVVVKTNFEMAGRLNKEGKRPNAKAVGSHASASLNYMDNHGAKDLERDDLLSNTYDANGDRLTKEDLDAIKKELNDGISAFRRTIIDIGQKEFDRDDLNRLVRESMLEFQENSGKDIDYVYAIHTDTDKIHAHILSYGKSSEVNYTKEHLKLFKETVAEKTHELILEKELEHKRDLSLTAQIDKSIEETIEDKEHAKKHSINMTTLSL